MKNDTKTVKASLGMLIGVIVLLTCIGMLGGYIGAHIGQPNRIEVSQSPNDANTIVPVSQQITVSPGKLVSDIAATRSKSLYLLSHKTAKGLKSFAMGVAVTNDGIIASTENGGTDPVFAVGDDAVSIEATPVGTDALTGLHFFKLTGKLISPINVAQLTPKIGSTLLALSRSSTTMAPQVQTAILSQINAAGVDNAKGVQRIGKSQTLSDAIAGTAILDEEGKLAGLLVNNDGSSILLAEDIAQAISRLSSNTLSQDPFADFGFTVAWGLQQDDQSHLSIKAAVQSVTPKGIASEAGLKAGDVITSVNASTVTWDINFGSLLAGNQIQLTVTRNGAPIIITLIKQAS